MKFGAVAYALMASSAAFAAMPKVLVMVEEKAIGSISTSEVESMAVKLLGDNGIETVDQNMVQNNLDRIQKVFRGAGDNRAAAAIGREFGADVILMGEAIAKPNAAKIGDSNLRSYNAAATFRAVRTDNSVNLASASETATVVALDDITGSSKVLRKAAEQALAALIPQMIARWEKPGAVGLKPGEKVAVTLTVGGMDQIWKLRETRMRLKGMKGKVASVAQKSYAQGVAVFNVESLLPCEELAEELVMDPPTDLKVQVVEIRETTLNLRVVEAPRKEGNE
jgi:hypothetical protein